MKYLVEKGMENYICSVLKSIILIDLVWVFQFKNTNKEKFVIFLIKESEWRWNHRNGNIYKFLCRQIFAFPIILGKAHYYGI